jgi:hypothetical protein
VLTTPTCPGFCRSAQRYHIIHRGTHERESKRKTKGRPERNVTSCSVALPEFWPATAVRAVRFRSVNLSVTSGKIQFSDLWFRPYSRDGPGGWGCSLGGTLFPGSKLDLSVFRGLMSSEAAYACDELQKEEGQRLLLAARRNIGVCGGLARVVVPPSFGSGSGSSFCFGRISLSSHEMPRIAGVEGFQLSFVLANNAVRDATVIRTSVMMVAASKLPSRAAPSCQLERPCAFPFMVLAFQEFVNGRRGGWLRDLTCGAAVGRDPCEPRPRHSSPQPQAPSTPRVPQRRPQPPGVQQQRSKV